MRIPEAHLGASPIWVKGDPPFADARLAVSPAAYIDWDQAEITEPGTTLRVPVRQVTPAWAAAFRAETENRRHRSFQDPWGQIGLIGVVIFVPAITPGAETLLRQTLDEIVAIAGRRAASAPPPESPAEMLELMRSLSGATLPG